MNENYTQNNPEEDIYDLALKNIKDFGLFSFQLEQQRELAIISQASQMLTAFSIFSAALLMLAPVFIAVHIPICNKDFAVSWYIICPPFDQLMFSPSSAVAVCLLHTS